MVQVKSDVTTLEQSTHNILRDRIFLKIERLILFMLMASKRYCSVPCCGEKIGSMYRFPKDPISREQWKSACKISRNVSNFMLVCYRHFSEDDIASTVSGKYSRLKVGAVPMLNLPDSIRMKGRRNCIIHTCQKNASQEVTLHFFPKNSELQTRWAAVCKLPGKVSRNTRVCSSHFSEDDFVSAGHGPTILKCGVMPSRNLPASFPSYRKSKLWTVSSTPYTHDNIETFDLFTDRNACASENTCIQKFIFKEQ